MDFNERVLPPELDVQKGITNCNGREQYILVLSVFCEDYEEKSSNIKKYKAEGKYQEYAVLVHGLKSEARSIGAYELGEKAYELELAGKAKDKDVIEAKTDALLEHYRKTVLSVKRAINNEEKTVVIAGRDTDVIQNLKDVIESEYKCAASKSLVWVKKYVAKKDADAVVITDDTQDLNDDILLKIKGVKDIPIVIYKTGEEGTVVTKADNTGDSADTVLEVLNSLL
ncbi:HPt (histidine-containing phosphotransfer) domain-containing protein [Acetitomaculum ruminis DSM 5522]|uniref:HPt (Histidine-containing phosphotransfer) domain-containing protein n=1 Tax=Acetitomaculum ruminis DSM 5522 TaxID=1120918 RepID=A0A1I0Z5W8_9FIRM|nr:Hpt domain-containing protein [Acetitomaculum ruminis]SFB20496.1 HPt (histidine-containing phosphotransfer) domain-containing protein [Acetitomaculum ruminis DSM 5522]